MASNQRKWQDITVRPAMPPEVVREPDGTYTLAWGQPVNLAVLLTAGELAELVSAATKATLIV